MGSQSLEVITIGDEDSSEYRREFNLNDRPKQILNQLNVLRHSGKFCDNTFIVSSLEHIHAHRAVLSVSSHYFQQMFTGALDLAKEGKQEITIREIDPQAFRDLIDYCYTSSLVIRMSNVHHLLQGSCSLELNEVKQNCCEFLASQLEPSNALEIRAVEEKYSCPDLIAKANALIRAKFHKVAKGQEFLSLPLKHLIEIISHYEFGICNAELIFNSVMAWVKHNEQERCQNLYQLLQLISFRESRVVDTKEEGAP